MSSTWRAKRAAQDSNFLRKLILRSLAIVFTIASLIAAVVIPQQFWLINWAIFFAPAWAMALVWNIVWISVMVKRERPIVPGVVVAFDLLIWGYYAVSVAFGWLYYALAEDWTVTLYRNNHAYGEIDWVHYRDVILAGVGAASSFAIICMLLHFWIFVHGCIDEDRRRKALKAAKTVKPNVPVEPIQMRCNAATICVDCHGPVQLRCADCAAMAAARGSFVPAPPEKPTYHHVNRVQSETSSLEVPLK